MLTIVCTCASVVYLLTQVVLEGPGLNTAVTGPAAAMALMMMYLKTGDADVAARFKVSHTRWCDSRKLS